MAACARRPQDLGFLRRPRRRRLGLRSSAMAGRARAASAANGVSNQRSAPGNPRARRRPPGQVRGLRPGYGLLDQQRRRGQRECAEACLQTHRPRQDRRLGTGLARQNRRRRRGDLGCARKMVRLSAHALRCEFRAARQSRRGRSNSSTGIRPQSLSSPCRVWAEPTMWASRCCRRCASAATTWAPC